jgi:hypothetical protein
LSEERYDCAITLQAEGAATGALTLSLEWLEDGSCTRLQLTRQEVALFAVTRGKATAAGKAAVLLPTDRPCAVTVLRRSKWLGVTCDGAFIFRGEVPRAPGNQAGYTADAGWKVIDARVQRLEPVAFADNFMRTAEESGGWAVQSGAWTLQSAWDKDPKGNAKRFEQAAFALNPFAWAGRNPQGAAICTTGNPFWEDYTFSVSLCPGAESAVGLLANMADPQHGLLLRWSPGNDHGPQGNGLALYRLDPTGKKRLALDAGGYVPGQWYRVQIVSSMDGMRVLVDGRERLTVREPIPWRGGIGLYAEGANGAIFDDVTVYGRGLQQDLLAENRLARLNAHFLDDTKGMGEWANARTDWVSSPENPGWRFHRLDFFGDHWLSVNVRPTGDPGRIALALNSDGKDPTAGYRAEVRVSVDGQQLHYALYRGADPLREKTGALLQKGESYSLRFRRAGKHLTLELDGAPVLEADDPAPLTGTRPAYLADGSFAGVRDVLALGRNLLDDLFTEAPVNWLTQGTWRPTVRWACSPEWSFLGGYSRGEAALWAKNRYVGDQTLEAFVGLLMEYPREHQYYYQRFRDLAVTICGDGHNPRSGYAGIYGAPDEAGNQNKRTVLLRNGVVVASVDKTMPGFALETHRQWHDLLLRKHGALVEFWIEGKLALSYQDPAPLAGGIPAVWTTDSAIGLTRMRMGYAQPPQPRIDPQVVIDEPWYPEWLNQGKALILSFPTTWSTTGNPVSLRVRTEQTPSGSKYAPSVEEQRVTFTPPAPGWYWYRIRATDGANESPDFHLTLPVFNAALGRDDSHTLLLYRFDEGKGNRVHDQSAGTPACDLAVPKGAAWIPGQGLSCFQATAPVYSVSTPRKLLPLVTSKTFTVELWVSTVTLFPPQGRSVLFAWGEHFEQWNFGVGQVWEALMIVPRYCNLWATVFKNNIVSNDIRNQLQHLVVTCNGNKITGYVNGVKGFEHTANLSPERWDTEAPLFLGMMNDGLNSYPGTYYLVAVHDRCLAPEQIQRHYQAGPGAR